MTLDDIVWQVAVGTPVLLLLILLGVIWILAIARKQEARLMVFKVSTIFRLRGRNDLAQQIMDAKDLQAVEKICREYDEDRRDADADGN